MPIRYHLSAWVRLKTAKEGAYSFCEVGTIVEPDFKKIINLDHLYSEVLAQCIGILKTPKLKIVNIKLMPQDGKIQITVRARLDEAGKSISEENQYRKLKFLVSKGRITAMGINRLFAYMELCVQGVKQGEFDSLAHVRIIQTDKADEDNLPADKADDNLPVDKT